MCIRDRADTTEKDIIFLDVEMPGVNGIYAGNKLRECYPNVLIFIVTSFMAVSYTHLGRFLLHLRHLNAILVTKQIHIFP